MVWNLLLMDACMNWNTKWLMVTWILQNTHLLAVTLLHKVCTDSYINVHVCSALHHLYSLQYRHKKISCKIGVVLMILYVLVSFVLHS